MSEDIHQKIDRLAANMEEQFDAMAEELAASQQNRPQADWTQAGANKPDYIRNKPALAAVATSGNYNDLSNRPSLATVATSGSYNDLSNKPAIPYNTGNYFTIASDTTGTCTVKLDKVDTPRDTVFQYNMNTSNDTWTDYTPGTVLNLSQYGYVRWRNKNPRALLSGNTGHWHFTITGNVILLGNINSLKSNNVTYNNIIGAYEYMELFKDNTTIIDASQLEMPCVVASANAYNAMFYGCTGMKHGPRMLPATQLWASCYLQMFRGCTALEEMPVLADPENFATNAYYQMFSACTSLKEAVLPAVDLGAYNYALYQMFNWCTSLKRVTVGFTGWGTGTTPTSIWLNNVAANGVFRCNKALPLVRDVDHIPAAWTVEYLDDPQADWDESDSTLSTYVRNKPTIPAGQIQSDWDQSDSSAVDYVKNKPLFQTPLKISIANPAYSQGIRIYSLNTTDTWDVEYSYDGKTWTPFTWSEGENFSAAASIGSGQTGNFIYVRGDNNTCRKGAGGGYMVFNTTENSSTDNAVVLSGNLLSVCRRERFWEITDLATISDYQSGKYAFYSVFRNTDGGKYLFNCIDAGDLILSATKVSDSCYNHMFNTSSIIRGPELPAMTLGNACYSSMFRNCASLQTPPGLPAVNLKQECYSYLFYGCSNLIYAPEIPAVSDTTGNNVSSMNSMFYGCTKIRSASLPNFTALSNNVCYQMFYGCSNLKYLKIGWSNFTPDGVTQPATDWLNGVPVPGVVEMPGMVATANRGYSTVPLNWYIDNTASPYIDWTKPYEQSQSKQNVWYQKCSQRLESTPSANTTVQVNIIRNDVQCLTVSNDITISIGYGRANCIAYSELVLDIAAGVTVSEGTNIVFADALTPGKRNICVVRQHDRDGKGKLYVVDVEDLPTA